MINMAHDWKSLAAEVTVPAEVAVALSTERAEFLRAIKRPFSEEEVSQVMNLIVVLFETNQNLHKHSLELARKIEGMSHNVKGLERGIRSLKEYAEFQTEGAYQEDEE